MTRTYVVTGSASGIGKATANLLTSQGHRVIGVDIRDADVVADLDVQYALTESAAGAVFVGGGISVHFRNGSGPAIAGTFVEDALDEIGAGLNAMIGGELRLAGPWRGTAEARGVVASGLSSASLRVGVMYRFPEAR